MPVDINFEDVEPIQLDLAKYDKWLSAVCEKEERELGELTIVLTSDEYLLSINKKYLKHDYYTDIITFDYTEGVVVNGDLFISIERVLENSEEYQVEFNEELDRVIVHGVLHLCGFGDKSDEEKSLMREKENQHLIDVSRET